MLPIIFQSNFTVVCTFATSAVTCFTFYNLVRFWLLLCEKPWFQFWKTVQNGSIWAFLWKQCSFKSTSLQKQRKL